MWWELESREESLREVIDREYSLLEKLGINIQFSTEIGKDISFEKLENYDAILMATGKNTKSPFVWFV